ncbi:MAG: hypothetical protein KQH57_19235 [Actinomycetales bacterium]|nr:hypothetical protein [Actinomycetales bacterium]
MRARSRSAAGATSLSLAVVLLATPAVAASDGAGYPYDQPGDKDYVSNTNVLERYTPDGAGNNQSYKVTSPRAQADATFTASPISVDGVAEPAWSAATVYPIANKFTADMSAAAPDATTQGTLRLLWDGPVLYGLVEVTGDTTESDTGTPVWSSASYQPSTDGLFVSMDVFNDQWGMETDTQGVFFLGANPSLASVTSFDNAGIPSLGSFFNPSAQDYSPRLKAFKSSGYTPGDGVNYTYEFALQIEGWGDAWDRQLTNGTEVGLELGVFDQGQSFTYWSKTQSFAGREGGSNLPNSERVRNRDWGVVTLAGWDGSTPFSYSGWRADEDVRFWDSASNPGGSGNGTEPGADGDGSLVWTPASKARMVAAKAAYLAVRDDVGATRAQKEAAVLEVCRAFAALRWGDTTYPDPHDLPSLQTIPSPLRFFDPTKGTDGMVTDSAEWALRKKELLDLAQFYEYGYKPQLGTDYSVSIVSNDYSGGATATVTAHVVPTNVNFSGGVPQDVTIRVAVPTAVPGDQKAVIGFGTGFSANGIADVSFPSWAFDVRSDPYVWGTDRSDVAFGTFHFPSTFYTLFPYTRNSASADSSILIANATAVSVYLDALQLAVAQNPALDAKIDPSRAVTKGFSIGGKNAFVAAIFDDRVKAVVAGGAGATGPANWRYNAQGQEFDFSGTDYYNPGAESIVAFGTEGPGNSYRHNRVRETELFRHFLPYGHMYEHQDGSYGYGSFAQLPFDQADLVATLAPDRAIVIDTNLNDYNDGAVTDNMSLEIAKSVYDNLGVDGADYVKFNSGDYQSSGDPHGAASAVVEGKFLSDFLYGSSTVSAGEAARISTDPYALDVSAGQTQSPYDYYWGGYNTITGGQGGVTGVDGWYFSGFDAEMAGLRQGVAGSGLNKGQQNALTANLDQVVKLLAKGNPGSAATIVENAFIGKLKGFETAGKLSHDRASALIGAAGQLILFINSADDVRPAWSGALQYDGGDEVTRDGALWRATYWTKGQEPGDANGPWQEIATDEQGVAIWTPSRIFKGGAVVSYEGSSYRAQWYTRNQEPGDPNGPWAEVAAPPSGGGAATWAPTTVYVSGDKVTYEGLEYVSQWWNRNKPPGAAYGPWRPAGEL